VNGVARWQNGDEEFRADEMQFVSLQQPRCDHRNHNAQLMSTHNSPSSSTQYEPRPGSTVQKARNTFGSKSRVRRPRTHEKMDIAASRKARQKQGGQNACQGSRDVLTWSWMPNRSIYMGVRGYKREAHGGNCVAEPYSGMGAKSFGNGGGRAVIRGFVRQRGEVSCSFRASFERGL